jgi:hypothetical protein
MKTHAPYLRLRTLSYVVLLLGLAACTSSVSGPEPLGDVSLDVQVTGGIAGVDYRLRVNGTDRLVRLECSVGCPPVASPLPPTVVALSEAQWSDLVRDLVTVGLPTIGIRDYGAACCDIFHLVIRYEDDRHLSRVSGDTETLPAGLAALAARLMALRDGTIPALFASGTTPGSGPNDPLTLRSAAIDGLRLAVEVTYSGGCEDHEMDVVFSGNWMESAPVQTTAWLTHEDLNDPCDALPTEIRMFDLSRLAAAYRASYPGAQAGERIVVHLAAPGNTSSETFEVVLP